MSAFNPRDLAITCGIVETIWGSTLPLLRLRCPPEMSSKERRTLLFSIATHLQGSDAFHERWTISVDLGRLGLTVETESGSPAEQQRAAEAMRKTAAVFMDPPGRPSKSKA